MQRPLVEVDLFSQLTGSECELDADLTRSSWNPLEHRRTIVVLQ
jgi:hypothetical protein